jgi:eukaryotic translation initiation factor 2C
MFFLEINSFESSSGVRKTVTDYFREAYQLDIQYDFLPCLQVGSDDKPNYLPMEVTYHKLELRYVTLSLPYFMFLFLNPFGFQVCKIVPGQKYQKKLEGQQVSKLMDSICLDPPVRERNICQVLALTAFILLWGGGSKKKGYTMRETNFMYALNPFCLGCYAQ